MEEGEVKIEDEGSMMGVCNSPSSILNPRPYGSSEDNLMLYVTVIFILCLQALTLATSAHAQKLEQIIADAKKEGEVTLIASASTFGGKKGFAELENLFAKRYGFKGKVSLTGGPSFPQVAARIIA